MSGAKLGGVLSFDQCKWQVAWHRRIQESGLDLRAVSLSTAQHEPAGQFGERHLFGSTDATANGVGRITLTEAVAQFLQEIRNRRILRMANNWGLSQWR